MHTNVSVHVTLVRIIMLISFSKDVCHI